MAKSIKKQPKAIDLFCGAGGLSEGLKNAGFDVVAAVEYNENVCRTYKENHKNTKVIRADISKLIPDDFLKQINHSKQDIVLIAGGPPCQGFSMANGQTRNKDNPKNKMVNHFARFVEQIMPPIFLMENVLGFKSIENGKMLKRLKKRFLKMGYKTSCITLNAANYGVPQNRYRVFLIGHRIRKELDMTLLPINNNLDKFRTITVREALIGDLPALVPPGENICSYINRPASKYQANIRGGMKNLHNHIATVNSTHVQKRQSFVPIGGNWKNVPRKYCKIRVQFSATYKRLDPNKPSITVSNFRKSMLIHPFENRGLSVREAARLQSFPDSYLFYGGICSMQQQVGDAVPPLLAKAVGEHLKAILV